MYRILCGSQEIFNEENIGELQVVSARQSEQLNESGNLQFTLAQGHPLYGLLEAMASYITAYDDDEVIFEGRVLECPKPNFSGQITYECEGALSYLMDSEVTPSKNPMTKTVEEFFAWCIAQHNADIGNDPKRTFTVGNVTVSDRAKSEKFQITSYTQTKTAIENNLINVYGGYLKIRHENGVRYLDWLEHYSDQVNPQLIVLGENVIEQAFNVNGENLFTVIRPVGKNGLLLDTQTINVFSSEEINNKYGRIIRSVSFSDADTKAKLQTKANEYISHLKATLLCSGSIRLVDMHYLDGTSPKIKMGARFNNIQGLEGITMTVSGMERNYMEPYIDDCSFGNDKSLSDGTPKGGGSISRATSRAGGAAGMNYKHIIELDNAVAINAETLDLHGQTLNSHYEQINQTANQVITMSNDIDNMDSRLQTVEGTGVIQNDELLAQFAGTMRLVRNSQGIVTGIQFVDGTMVMDTDEEGHMVTVGAAIAANTGAVQTIEGSALWNQRDNITGVAGEFDIVEDPVTHVKTIVIKSGGGMKIRRNNVEYGLYDSGNLTGGLLVDKLNDGTVVTTIRGDIIDLSSNGQKTACYVQATDPSSNHTMHDGDIWIKRNNNRTWNQAAAAHEKWNQPGVKWRSKYGDIQYVWRNGAWVLVKDYALDVENEVNLHKTRDSLEITGHAVDTLGQVFDSSLRVTAREIRTELTDKANGLQSSITQTAGQIRSEVSSSVSNLHSSITQNADKIALVVEGTGANAKIKPAQIVAAINDGESSILISANHVNLDGYVKATDITAEYINGKIAGIQSVGVKNLAASGTISIKENNVYYGIQRSIKDIQIVLGNDNVYTLQYKKWDDTQWQSVQQTFSRAVSTMSADWSAGNGTVKITAHPQEQVSTFTLPLPTATCTNTAAYYYKIVVKCAGRTRTYSLQTNSSGGIVEFKVV